MFNLHLNKELEKATENKKGTEVNLGIPKN